MVTSHIQAYSQLDINVLNILLLIALVSTILSCVISLALIVNHQIIMKEHATANQIDIFRMQSKIVGIIWMIPIYSISSFLGLICPIYVTTYLDMLRDCYEAYVLYLFLSLLFSYLCYHRGDEYALIMYIERNHSHHKLKSYFWNEKETGKSFLRNCKFGTLQYCLVRPLSTLVAIILDQFGLYNESEFNVRYGYVYIIAIMNCSVMYSFMALASFYSVFKYKLKPFHPVSKFLCIKFIIFFIFWQSFAISIMIKIDWIRNDSFDSSHNLSAKEIAIKLQDLLICIEMVFASIAFLYAFSYRPFMGEDSSFLISSSYNNLELDDENANYSNNMYSFETDSTKNLLMNEIHEHPLYNKGNNQSTGFDTTNAMFTNNHKFEGNNINANNSNDNCELEGDDSPNDSDRNLIRSSKLKHTLAPLEQLKQQQVLHTDNVIMISDSKISAHGLSTVIQKNKPQVMHNTSSLPSVDILKTPVISKKQHQQQQKWLRNNQQTSIKYQQLAHNPNRNTAIDIGVLDKHFSLSTAIRDFNESMPMVVLPSGFEMTKGVVIHSDPTSRLP